VRSRNWDTVPGPLKGCVVLSLYDCLVTHQTKGALMFTSLTSKVWLALLFFAMFIVGSYWWMVFGPGRGL
jgi:hypothetical protein